MAHVGDELDRRRQRRLLRGERRLDRRLVRTVRAHRQAAQIGAGDDIDDAEVGGRRHDELSHACGRLVQRVGARPDLRDRGQQGEARAVARHRLPPRGRHYRHQ